MRRHAREGPHAARELVAEREDEVTDPKEILDALVARLGPDTGSREVFNSDALTEGWITPFPGPNRRLAREQYFRLQREFGLLNWERLPAAMRAIGVSMLWSGTHPPIPFNQGSYNPWLLK